VASSCPRPRRRHRRQRGAADVVLHLRLEPLAGKRRGRCVVILHLGSCIGACNGLQPIALLRRHRRAPYGARGGIDRACALRPSPTPQLILPAAAPTTVPSSSDELGPPASGHGFLRQQHVCEHGQPIVGMISGRLRCSRAACCTCSMVLHVGHHRFGVPRVADRASDDGLKPRPAPTHAWIFAACKSTLSSFSLSSLSPGISMPQHLQD